MVKEKFNMSYADTYDKANLLTTKVRITECIPCHILFACGYVQNLQ